VNDTLHEARDTLTRSTLDAHRAYASLMEELEAIDWYSQRIDASTDEELKNMLSHNREEEMEHAAMLLEWLRRHEPAFDAHLKTFLFTEGPILERRADSAHATEQIGIDLAIGGLRRDVA